MMNVDTADEPDADNPAMAQVHKYFSQLLKAQFVMTVDPKGAITEATGLDSMWDEMAKADPKFAMLARNMKQTMGDEQMKRMVDFGTTALPDKPVGVGAVWQNQAEAPIPGLTETRIDIRSILTKLEQSDAGQIAHIKSTAKTNSKGGQLNMGQAQVNLKKMSIDQDGTYTFNVDKGMMKDMKMNQAIDMSMNVPNPQMPEGLDLDMKINGVVTMTMGPRAKEADATDPQPAQTQ
jgi:hypothetical protein